MFTNHTVVFSTKNLNEVLEISGEFETLSFDFDAESHTDSCSGILNGFYGKKHSEETKKLIAQKTIENLKSDAYRETRINRGSKNGMFGVHRFGELNPMFGKKMSDEARGKMREAAAARYANGYINPRRGSKLTREAKNEISDRNSKTYVLLSPSGEVEKIKNLTKFAKENDLSIGCLWHVVSGKNKSHKGWSKYDG
jgi:hypothetical protein